MLNEKLEEMVVGNLIAFDLLTHRKSAPHRPINLSPSATTHRHYLKHCIPSSWAPGSISSTLFGGGSSVLDLPCLVAILSCLPKALVMHQAKSVERLMRRLEADLGGRLA
jgi:small neutral amino acid transporter SnatA (MarC family)